MRLLHIATPAKSTSNHYSTFCFLLCFLFILSSSKHSYLDRETSLILKSIAGKPTHLLTKVTFSYTFFSLFFCCMHTLLFSSALCASGRIHATKKQTISYLENLNKIVGQINWSKFKWWRVSGMDFPLASLFNVYYGYILLHKVEV